MIQNASENDFTGIYEVINDAAMAYKGINPEDRWHEPSAVVVLSPNNLN